MTNTHSLQRMFILHDGDAGNVLARVKNLTDAAEAAQLEAVVLNSACVDYTDLPTPAPGDLLYNAGRGSARLETLLMRPNIATFYTQNPSMIFDRHDSTVFTAQHEKSGVPGPKTIHRLPSKDAMFADYVEFLGGFPIVLKAIGGTGGIGTVIVESMRSLKSLVELFRSQKLDFIMREFIEPAEIGRLTILDQSVVASNRKFVKVDDFRTSIVEVPVQPRKYPKHIEDIAIAATRCCGLEFGGVDILIGRDGREVVLEMNFPCDYVTSEQATGIAIGKLMVDYLRQKADRILAGQS